MTSSNGKAPKKDILAQYEMWIECNLLGHWSMRCCWQLHHVALSVKWLYHLCWRLMKYDIIPRKYIMHNPDYQTVTMTLYAKRIWKKYHVLHLLISPQNTLGPQRNTFFLWLEESKTESRSDFRQILPYNTKILVNLVVFFNPQAMSVSLIKHATSSCKNLPHL